ncbi:MAG: FAD-dependent oxidoreductase [Thermoanaerobaculia bacterium]
MTSHRDVVIVGGGPVGLAAAIAAARRGLATTVVEAQRPPIDKACGEGLMPSGLAALTRLGVELEAGRPFTGIRYVSDGVVAEADFPHGARGRGVRRTELHAALVRAAEAAGVELRWNERVLALASDGVESAAGRVAARFVVGADGLHSKVRSWVGFARPAPVASTRSRFGVRRHFAHPPWSERVEVTFGRGAEAYVTPVGEREVGVALLWSGGASSFDQLLAERFPAELGERLTGVPELSRHRGAGPLRQSVRAAVAGRVALVGDAAGYIDALTGEGLSLGFSQAEALAAALAAADLGAYARAHRRLGGLANRLTRFMLIAAARPRLRRRLVAALARDPAFFARLLGALGCDGASRELVSPGALRLALGLIVPRSGGSPAPARG